MRTPVLVLALLVLLGAISIDISSTGSEVKNEPKDEVIKDDIHNGQVMEGPDFDRKKKPGRKSGKKSKKKKGKKGKKGKKAGLFKKFKNTALSNFDSEIANLSCSKLEDFQSSYEGCGLTTWLGCLNAGYKVWTSCEKTCDDEKLCTLSCVKKKIDGRTICKNCIKQLLKALCCHFIGGECCIKADSEVTGDICCHIQTEVERPLCSNGKPMCSADHVCPSGEQCCPDWPPVGADSGCCYNDSDECPSISVLNIEHEDGRNITQNVIINHSSGLLTLESTASDVLQKNVTRSTSILHADSNTTIIKSNSSCVLSDISHDINVGEISQFFKELNEGTATLDVENKEVVHDIKIIKSIVGPEERKTLHSDMHNLCNDHVIEKTENKRIPKDEYEKLVNGEIIYLKDETENTRSSCETQTTCSQRWTSASSNTGRYDPVQKKYVLREQVSSTAICFSCCVESPDCNCTCPCEKIDQNQMTFEDCYIRDGNLDFKFQDSEDSQLVTQSNTWSAQAFTGLRSNSSISDVRSFKIHIPSHEDVEETTVLMHADENGDWHNVANNMMVKVGSKCHIRTLPQDISPFEIALGMKHIKAGNITAKPDVERKKYSLVLNRGRFTSNEVQNLNQHIKESCNNVDVIKSEVADISEEEFQIINNGGVILRENEKQTRACFNPNATITDEHGCFRYKNPLTGETIYMHEFVSTVHEIACCFEISSSALGGHCDCSIKHPENCRCDYIKDAETLKECAAKKGASMPIAGEPDQIFAYTPQTDTDDAHLTINTEAQNNLEAASMVLGIVNDKTMRSESQEYLTRVLKTSRYCYVLRSLWYGNRWEGWLLEDYNFPWYEEPLQTALNAKETALRLNESFNGVLTTDIVNNYTSVLVSIPHSITSLPSYIDTCDGMDIIEAYEVKIEQKQYDDLEEGNIITLPGNTSSKCTLLTKCALNQGSTGIRWPTPRYCNETDYYDYWYYYYDTDPGVQCAIHGLVAAPMCLACCAEGLDPNYYNCNTITDIETFHRYQPDNVEMIAVIAGGFNEEKYSHVEFFIRNQSSQAFQLEALPLDEASFFPVNTSGAVGAWINKELIVCQGHGQVEDSCYIRQSDYSWEKSSSTILTEPLEYGGTSAKYKSGPTGNEEGETWWVLGGDYEGKVSIVQEWNSVLGPNPWDPPILPNEMYLPCMVSISKRNIFVTSVAPDFTSKAWIFSRDYPDNGGWKIVPKPKEMRFSTACGFLPNEGSGWIILAGGHMKSSTEILDVTHCENNDWNCDWVAGPDLGKNYLGATLVTMLTGDLVLFGDNEDILAINSTFESWQVVGKMSLPLHNAVVLSIDEETDNLFNN